MSAETKNVSETASSPNHFFKAAREVGILACVGVDLYLLRHGLDIKVSELVRGQIDEGVNLQTLAEVAGVGVVGNALQGREHVAGIIRGEQTETPFAQPSAPDMRE